MLNTWEDLPGPYPEAYHHQEEEVVVGASFQAHPHRVQVLLPDPLEQLLEVEAFPWVRVEPLGLFQPSRRLCFPKEEVVPLLLN